MSDLSFLKENSVGYEEMNELKLGKTRGQKRL